MTRYYVRFVLIPILLLTAALLLIRTQPYDDHDLKAWVMPADCSAPCIMGIQPGVTTMLEAVQLLRKNSWVSQVIPLTNEQRPSQIWWLWNENAPNYLKKGTFRYDGQILATVENKVGFVNFGTTLAYGDILLILGTPDKDALVSAFGIPEIPVSFELWYLAHHTWVTGGKPCPYYTDIWHTSTQFSIADVDPSTAARTVLIQPIPDVQLRTALRKLSRQVCGY